MNRIRTDILEIAFEEGGPPDGTPVLLLHGWPDAPRGWNEVSRRLQADGFRTIAPFLRGSSPTEFLSRETPRVGAGVALAQDALDLADAQMPSVLRTLPCWGTIGGRGRPTY